MKIRKLILHIVLLVSALCLDWQIRAQSIAMQGIHKEINGVNFWYVDTGGNGVPVVFLHAATGTVQSWEYQISTMTQAGFRFISYDRRGKGKSLIIDSENRDISAVDDLAALMKHLGVERFHLVGVAAGGGIAVDYALTYPQQLRSLVVVNSLAGITDESFQELGRKLRPPQFSALPPEIRELGPAYRAENPKGTQRWIEIEQNSQQEGKQITSIKMRNKITLSRLEEIRIPTLLVTGGADFYMPPAVLRLLASHIKGATVSLIPDAGHSTYWEKPQVFNKVILKFFDKRRAISTKK